MSTSKSFVDSPLAAMGRQYPLGIIATAVRTVQEEEAQEKQQKLHDLESNEILASLMAARKQAQAAKEAEAAAATASLSGTSATSTHFNARFKKWQVQQEILSKNELLSAMVTEIPWKNVLGLCHLKFLAAGELLWRQHQQQTNPLVPSNASSSSLSSHHLVVQEDNSPQDIAFVLAGGLVLRHQPPSLLAPNHNRSQRCGAPTSSYVSVPTEHTLPVGACVGAGAVEMGSPLLFDVKTARFKSIIVMFPKGKFKSILKQLTPKTRAKVLAIIHRIETEQLQALGVDTASAITSGTQYHQQHSHHHPHYRHHPHQKHQSHTMRQRPSTAPAMISGARGGGNNNNNNNNGNITWASLIVPHPAEYEVDSSVLIVHGRKDEASTSANAASTGNSTTQGAGEAPKDKKSPSNEVWRDMTKKNTQKRLDTIRLPQEVEAFPKNVIDAARAEEMEKNLWARFLAARDRTEEKESNEAATGSNGKKKGKGRKTMTSNGVAQPEKIGRLLKPIKKHEVLSEDETRKFLLLQQQQTNSHSNGNSSGRTSERPALIHSRRTEIIRSSDL